MIQEVNHPHVRGYVTVSVEVHECIMEVIDEDGCSGKSGFVVVVTKLSKGEQCFVLHLGKYMDASHCVRKMQDIGQCVMPS